MESAPEPPPDDALDGPAQKRLLRTIEEAVVRQSPSFARVDLIPC